MQLWQGEPHRGETVVIVKSAVMSEIS